jgi:hypothetical protein
MCVCQCCMWCLEKCMKFLNKNAYIITAIYGYSFLKSARVAFFTLLRNILRVAAVNMVSDFILMLGKVFVPMSTVFVLYLIMVFILINITNTINIININNRHTIQLYHLLCLVSYHH